MKRQWVVKYPPSNKITKVNTILLRNCILFAHNLLLLAENTCDGDEFIKKSFFKPTYKFSERLL